MRKRTKRKVWSTPAIPIVFGMTQAGLNSCRLLGAAAIDAIASGEGTDDHIAQVKQIADYCSLIARRLKRDGSVAEPDELKTSRIIAIRCRRFVRALQYEFATTGAVHCSTAERAALLELLDTNDALDSVATRRQARDVMVEMIDAMTDNLNSGVPHAIRQQARV